MATAQLARCRNRKCDAEGSFDEHKGYCPQCVSYFLDGKKRRKRTAGRQSTGVHVLRSDADIEGFFLPLQRHGKLYSHYLVEFRKQRTKPKDRDRAVRRLGLLYHESNSDYGGPCLNRRARAKDWRPIPYSLDDWGREAIPELKRHKYATRADLGWDAHQNATACITGSIDLAAYRKYGTDIYGDQESIYTHKLCPPATLKLKRPIELYLGDRTEYDKRTGIAKTVPTTIIADQLFKLLYPTNIKFFGLETDMASETWDTITEKFRRWCYALKHDIPRKQWGTPSFILLVVTTDPDRMRQMMELFLHCAAEADIDTDAVLFKCEPRLVGIYTVPILWHFFDEPWHRADGSTFDISY